MKLKKILLQLGLLLAFVGVGIGGMVVANAAATIPAGSQAVDLSNGNVYEKRAYAWSTVDNTDNGNYTMSGYPEVSAIRADYVTASGRISTKTKKIYILLTGTAKSATNDFNSMHADVMINGGKSVSTSTPKNFVTNDAPKVTMPTSYQEVDVDLSDLSHLLPLYVGIKYTVEYQQDGDPSYYQGLLKADQTAIASMANVIVTPTSGTDSNGVSNLSASDKSISGTAEPSSTVAVTLTKNGTSKTYSTTAASDGKYTIPLDNTLSQLCDSKSITVSESTETGDSKSATANVVATVPLTITPSSANLTISPDDWDANIKGKSSSDIATWLAKQSNLVVTKQNSSTALTASGDGLAFDTASDLSTLAAGATQAVQINASDSAGDKSTDPATINVTRGLGNMQFTTISQLIFGNGATLAVPSTQTLYAPGNYDVDVSDSRATGSPWYLTAKASTLTDGDGGHTFSGHVVYADGKGTVTPLDDGNAVQVGSGTRSSSTYDLASSWNQKGNSYTGSSAPAGVYLQANPNVYAGSSSTAYSGTMTWTLADTPDLK